jgi:hypothetical protein
MLCHRVKREERIYINCGTRQFCGPGHAHLENWGIGFIWQKLLLIGGLELLWDEY